MGDDSVPGSPFDVRIEKLEPSRVRLAFHQVADALRTAIIHGELPPGTKLPTEPDLAAQFQVSRSTIREALRILAAQRLIRTTRGVRGGSFVALPGPDEISEVLQASIGLLTSVRMVALPELLEARELLEVPAARLAATRRSSAHVKQMRAAVESPIRDVPRQMTFQTNEQFHLVLLDAAGNHLMRLVTQPIYTFIRDHYFYSKGTLRYEEQVREDHVLILDAVEANDPELAAIEMKKHLDRLRPIYQSR